MSTLKLGQKMAILNEQSTFVDYIFEAGTALIVGNSDDTEAYYKDYLARHGEDIIGMHALLFQDKSMRDRLNERSLTVVFLGNHWRLLAPADYTIIEQTS